ncbi:MAG: methylenetetrahydrofolate reductase C-terminal domain-containing protein, partial [Candidatus Aminicenantes bacterium]|nr:methylenetetrahydrofolate reductase C-terminal domain-containing protein [Candidatus Aminicenantes bacterium]
MKPFLLLAELVPAQADDVRSIERFLLDYASRKSEIHSDFRLAGITLPQNPRGNAMLDPADIYTLIAAKTPPPPASASVSTPDSPSASKPPFARGLWADLEVIPHLTGKEQNGAALRSTLMGFRALGLTSVLAITGDKPSPGKRVFEVDSVGLLRLIADMNFDAYQRAPVSRLTAPASIPLPSSNSSAPAASSSAGPLPSDASSLPSLPEILAGRPLDVPISRPSTGFASVPQFFPLAAVSPFKYTEASLVQQYFKLGKKIRAGAAAILMQMGWDSRKSEELFRYLRDARLRIPVFGNVYYLTTANPAARLMHEGQIPGCYVSDALLAAVRREKAAGHIERAAAQTAMYRDLGAAGVDLGGLPDFETLIKVVARAAEIGSDWRAHRGILDYPPLRMASGAAPFYLYGGPVEGAPASAHPFRPSPRPRSFHQKHFDFLHRSILTKGKCLNPAVTGTAKAFKSLDRGDGFLYRLVHGAEKASKSFLFKCEDCGDCFLPENFGYCTLGECEKGLPNPPCGDATPDGFCGNNLKRVCVAESIYNAAAAAIAHSQSQPRTGENAPFSSAKAAAHTAAPAAVPGPDRAASASVSPLAVTPGLSELAATSLPSRMPDLANTSAVLNYLFNRDHTRPAPLIQIAELLHASIPRTAAAMQEVIDRGFIPGQIIRGQVTQLPNSSATPPSSAALGYLISLVKMQARHGAAYIDVNVDALSEDDLEFRKEILRFFIHLIREHGEGVPVCIDSSSPDMLEAGLAAWYEDAGPAAGVAASSSPAVPLLNSVKTYTMERLLSLRAKHPFKFIGLLVDKHTAGRDGAYGVDELLGLAREIFRAATGRYGFSPSDIFFDSTVFPLSIDVPMDAEKPGYTYRAFETIRRIKNDPAFAGVHLSLGVTNSVRDLPGRRTGVTRAYIALAMARGLDAGIVNVFHEYGKRPPAPELIEFVDAFVR